MYNNKLTLNEPGDILMTINRLLSTNHSCFQDKLYEHSLH